MPFSMAENCCNQSIFNHNPLSDPSNKKTQSIVTLQVRTILKDFIFHFRHEKKAFLSASLTLEAAIGLSLFIFASVCMLLPMKLMNTERRIQAALEETGEDFSRYAYLKEIIGQGMESMIPGADDSAWRFSEYLTDGAGGIYARANVLNHVDTDKISNVELSESEIFTDGEFIDLVCNYEFHFPFPVLGVSGLSRTARCRRRAWIGLAGKDYDGSGSSGTEEDPVVYVGKTSTRYHWSRSCHYLANNLTAVPVASIEVMRNSSGGKYRPCAVCGKAEADTVYIMASGKSYHTDRECGAIISYARAVRLSEVAYLGACSYCGK
ncbi:MAG: hypothetical protein LIO92_03165 [Clostridiales bacterium]|nr:hypothetical protein [Clostridiales bacterium]